MYKKVKKRLPRKYLIKKRQIENQKKIARERIEILYGFIKKEPKGKWAGRYKKLIKKMSKKYRVPNPFRKAFKH